MNSYIYQKIYSCNKFFEKYILIGEDIIFNKKLEKNYLKNKVYLYSYKYQKSNYYYILYNIYN